MTRPGRLAATFKVPHAGVWNLWLQGQIMPQMISVPIPLAKKTHVMLTEQAKQLDQKLQFSKTL